jgi:hypothetical protein
MPPTALPLEKDTAVPESLNFSVNLLITVEIYKLYDYVFT